MNLKETIRNIPNFPKKGIIYRDITTLLKNPEGLKEAIDALYKRYKNSKIDLVAGIESRGFIIGTPLAYKLNAGFIPVRKAGKLPGKTIKEEYELEYGTDSVEIHEDAIKKGQRVLVVDDLIATGGTVSAALKLVEKLGGEVVEVCFLIELPDLKGVEKLNGYKYFSLIHFDGH